VHESVQPTKEEITYATGLGDVLALRGENLPLFRLATLLGRKVAKERPISESIAIVVRTAKHPFAVLVDDIIGQQQVVIKRLGSEVQNIKGVSGGAILGDGRAALILDFPELSARAVPKAAPVSMAPTPKVTEKPLLKEVA
jgi:two-component system chemotaxis sensor kinase CheA